MAKNTPLSLDDLFGGCHVEQAENVLTKTCHDLIDEYPNQPRYLTQENLDKGFLESVKACGVYEPVILSIQKNGRRLMLAGHKRLLANKLAGNTEIIAIEKQGLEQWQEKIIVGHTNFQQGVQNMSHSERYRSMSLEMDALVQFRQYLKDNKLDTKGEIVLNGQVFQLEHLEKSRDLIAKRYHISGSDVQRIMRIKYLCKQFMLLLDKKDLPFRAAVALSYLTENQQEELYNALGDTKITVDKATTLKELSEQNLFLVDNVLQVLNSTDITPCKENRVSLAPKLITTYFTGKSQEYIAHVLDKALEEYFAKMGA